MANNSRVTLVVCRHCQHPLQLVRRGGAVVFYEQCDRHPHNQRSDGESVRTVPYATASRDVMTVGVLLSDLLRGPRRGPYAV